jgi:DNA-binding response OmpR family regulator
MIRDIRRPDVTGPGDAVIVLAVDDDPAILELLKLTLTDEGFTVASARNGAEALVSYDEVRPDVIVLDLEMPVMDGRTFYRELRERGNATPVLLVSAHGARAALRELGAEGAIEKPFDPYALGRRLRSLVPDGH